MLIIIYIATANTNGYKKKIPVSRDEEAQCSHNGIIFIVSSGKIVYAMVEKNWRTSKQIAEKFRQACYILVFRR